MSKGFASSHRIVLLAAGLLVCFGGFGARLVWLHVVERDALLRTITKTRHQLIVEPAQRGNLLDVKGAVLAASVPVIVLGVDPMSLRPQDEHKWPELAAMLNRPEPELRKIFTTKHREAKPGPIGFAASKRGQGTASAIVFNVSSESEDDASASDEAGDAPAELADPPDERGQRPIRWVKLSDAVPESLYAEIEKLGVHGVYGQRVYRRVYPNNQLAAHIVGYVDRQQQAVTGMEFYADFYLRGHNGWRVGERDGRNRELPQFTTRHIPASDGFSVRLSIHAVVQDIVEQELGELAQRFKPLKATIIVSEPATGFILGLANYPTYNPNEYNKVPRDEVGRLRNIAVADVYEPGSVFKIVAASAALQEGLVSVHDTFDCSLEKLSHRGRMVPLPGEDHAFDHPLSLPDVITRSSNRGAAQLGVRVGEEKFHRYAQAFGFGRTLGFPVGAEVPGILAPWQKWHPIDITRIAMGQSIAATVLQMHQAMCAIANGGVLLRPQLVREIRDPRGEIVFERRDGIEINRVLSPRVAQAMAAMLMGVTSKNGTAPRAAIQMNGIDFETAGKTGTTQKLVDHPQPDGTIKRVYSSKHHVASFVGFFPASRPAVAISVIVDEADAHAPGGIAYGGAVAAPSFKRIGEKLIPILDIKAPSQLARPPLVATNKGGRR